MLKEVPTIQDQLAVQKKHEAGQKVNSLKETPQKKGAQLAQIELFQDLNAEELRMLEHAAVLSTYRAGNIFYQPGEKGTALFLLKEGTIQLYHLSTDGRKLIIATLEAGASFGEMLLIGEHTQDCFAEALTSVCVYTLSIHHIEQLFKSRPTAMSALLQKLGQRVIRLEEQLVDATFKSVAARLATLLLSLATISESTGSQILTVSGLSHEELADRLGVYRETVSATLRELKEAGAIELRRKHITICNPIRLQEIAASTGKVGHA